MEPIRSSQSPSETAGTSVVKEKKRPIQAVENQERLSSNMSAKLLGGQCSRRPRGGQTGLGVYFDEGSGNIIENVSIQFASLVVYEFYAYRYFSCL